MAPTIDTRSSERLLVCFFGIFFLYLLFGLCQEKINRGDYDGERFIFPQALVFFQCIVNAIFAKLISHFVTRPGVDSTPTMLYASCSVCYMGAMVASNQALQYINYPTQVLGKSCKPIPVMILGVILAKKRYPLAKYFCVLMIVAGVASFMYKENNNKTTSDSVFGYGEILLIISLTLDGLTGVTQENMRSKHSTNQHHMMYNVNLWSTILLFMALCVNGQGLACFRFIYKHPQVISHLAMFSLTSAFGQHFIFLTVVYFGPLTCSIITTTRKFFTILGSVILFQNPLTSLQWFGALLVFAGLGFDAKYGKAVKMAQTDEKDAKK
ncbi:solute carrier family 35 member B1-like isoform X2 [Styela clava]